MTRDMGTNGDFDLELNAVNLNFNHIQYWLHGATTWTLPHIIQLSSRVPYLT